MPASSKSLVTKRKRRRKRRKRKLTQAQIKAKIRANRKKIRAGITVDEIMGSYWVNELRDYCRAEGIQMSGRKADLAKKIVVYLKNPNERGYVPTKKARLNRRRSVLRNQRGFIPFGRKSY